jgi:hypothetical protein
LESVLPKCGVDYPLFITGGGAAPPEDAGPKPALEERLQIMKEPAHPHYDMMVKSYGQFEKNSFEPQSVVFEDPDVVWIYFYWEEHVLSQAMADIEKAIDENIGYNDGRYPIKLPARSRDRLVAEGLVPSERVAGNADELLDPGFVTAMLTTDDVTALADAVRIRASATDDVPLRRLLRRLDWYLDNVQELLEDSEWDDDD